MPYDRWIPFEKKSWPYRKLKANYDEVNRLMMANKAATKFTCDQLDKLGAKDDSPASKFLHVGKDNNKLTIKDWHKSYTLFNNWTYLNAVMALSSAFESYLSSIITMAIDSDPGMIINATKTIDGIKMKKDGQEFNKELVNEKITSCTKGDWTARTNAMKTLLGTIPDVFTENIEELDNLRTLRNKVGHAFGRDIDRAKDYTLFRTEPMIKLKYEKFRIYQSLILKCSSKLDEQLQKEHIGLYHYLLFYHNNIDKLKMHPVDNDRHVYLKTLLGKESQRAIPKDLSSFLISHYESL